MGMRASGSHDIEFRDAFIADECLVGVEGAGTEGGNVCLPWYALGIAAVYTGVAGAAFDFAVEYLKQRTLHPLPASVAHLPGSQFTVAEMQIQLETSRALIYKTAAELAHGADFGARTAAGGDHAAVRRHAQRARRRHQGDAGGRRPEHHPPPAARALVPRRPRRHPAPVHPLLAAGDDRQGGAGHSARRASRGGCEGDDEGCGSQRRTSAF